MIPQPEELKASREDFAEKTAQALRVEIEKGFVDSFALYNDQMHAFNSAMATLPYSIFGIKPSHDYLYDNYDNYCKDIMILFNKFVTNEVDFEDFFNQELPDDILAAIVNDEAEIYHDKINHFLGMQTVEIIVRPFFMTLLGRLVEHKIGVENFLKIKDIVA